MSKYHDRTLDLLSLTGFLQEQETPRLLDWARGNSVRLPASYLEWARLDRLGTLEKCSDRDTFSFEEPKIITTPAGVSGLLFQEESHGSFQKIVVLNQGDDPPVLYSWKGKPPWITYAERFSDCVYAQVFDWQHLLEVDTDHPAQLADIACHGDIDLMSDACLDDLRGKFTESVKTRFADDREIYNEYRFLKTRALRLTVTVAANGRSNVRITGPAEQSVRLENELFDSFGDEAVLPTFNSLTAALNHLGACAGWAQFAKLSHSCINAPEPKAIERLFTCHASLALTERLRPDDFPRNATTFEVGGGDWGINIRFQRQSQSWWWIEAIY